MKRVRHLSEEALHQVASQIGESFWDYPYADGEGGLLRGILHPQFGHFGIAATVYGFQGGVLAHIQAGERIVGAAKRFKSRILGHIKGG